ncbi:MAG: 16S rRNA (guanine(527)-N(7))-methyltransferase RsmG [Alphaproteobacteria bacterium]|nr:16S rRNA (guanine(527)-N(7))-methyltransferase RsmG [Alphaproteobacteria bacterium]
MHDIVSRETIGRLESYQNILEVWQKKLNLVSSSSLQEAWDRHFRDSYQLLSYLPQNQISLIDLGSGAGFPGLVLAILRPENLSVTLVESDFKKCVFLENVSRETMSSVTILQSRIESLPNSVQADVITARALATLSHLLDYAFPLMKEKSICLFLKGKEANKEIEEAQKKWIFDLEIYPSLTDSTGRILKIEHLKKK